MDHPDRHIITHPAALALQDLLAQCGDLLSLHLKPRPAIPPTEALDPLWGELMQHPEVQRVSHDWGTLAPVMGCYTMLNRLEFEGSLLALIRQGGCHRQTAQLDLPTLRQRVIEGLEAMFPAPFDNLVVYRLDDPSWCSRMQDATLSAAYLACQSARGLWWMVGVADYD